MVNHINHPTFLVHDYEMFGKHPALDRPAQFAGIRADSSLQPIGEPEMFFCRPTDDYLPEPEAVLITGITPQKALRDGVNEAEFARKIHKLFSVPKTCFMGYNNPPCSHWCMFLVFSVLTAVILHGLRLWPGILIIRMRLSFVT